MAGWNDLPTELRQIILEVVHDEPGVRHGTARRNEGFRTLLALSTMDRELYALATPLLWETITISDRSISRHVTFAQEFGPRKGRFVRHLVLYHPKLKANKLGRISETYGACLASAPNIRTPHLHARSAFVVGIIPLLSPEMGASVTWFVLHETEYDILEPLHVAALLHALPRLVDVELSGVNETDGAALLIKALRQLPSLLKLQMASGDALVHRSVGQPWKSSLTSLNLDGSNIIDFAVLQALLSHHSSTLRELSLPSWLRKQHDFPSFSLPRLETLQLWTSEISAPILLAFSQSPLRRLRIKMYLTDNEITEEVEAVLATVQQHVGTLQEVRLSARAYYPAAIDEEHDMLDRLEALCMKEKIVYRIGFESS